MYFIQAKNINNLNFALASNLSVDIDKYQAVNAGIQLATNKAMHFQTMEDLMGAISFHNVNTYAVGNYATTDGRVQYDMNNPNGFVGEGDRFGYDYNILVDKASAWMSYKYDRARLHSFISGRIGGVEMQRDGKMRNGMFADNSYGKSRTAHFLEGGVKIGGSLNFGKGHVFTFGTGTEWKAPQASTAFVAPEMNNDFVVDLKNEKVFSAEAGYQLQTSWLKANINGYYSKVWDATDWQNFYFDDINSFSYVSLTGQEKVYYGVEWGLNFKITSAFNIKAIGSICEAKNTNNAQVWYMSSTKGTYNDAPNVTQEIYNEWNGQPQLCMNKNMREAGTPLTALSLILSYHQGGWFIDLNGNWYDRIYLSYSPCYRYESTLRARAASNDLTDPVFDKVTGALLPSAVEQTKGKGGFMLDCSIGKSIYLHHGRSMSINLSITNLLNNRSIVTGGYEQSRSDYSGSGNARAYSFSRNPMKYYAYGINGMLNIAYKF